MNIVIMTAIIAVRLYMLLCLSSVCASSRNAVLDGNYDFLRVSDFADRKNQETGNGVRMERRERRDGGTDLFHSIAGLSGGTVVGTDKGDVGSAVGLISAGLSGSQVYLKKVHVDSRSLSQISFDVDTTLRSLTIQVQCDKARPQFGIKDPSGKIVTAGDPNVNMTVDSAYLRALTIGTPTTGQWMLKLLGINVYDATVQGVSSVDFISSFKDKDGMDLPGSPFAGQPTFLSIETVGGDYVSNWTSLIIMSNSNGTVLQRISLDSPIGRRRNLYKVNVTFPYQSVYLGVEGLDKSNHTFTRIHINPVNPQRIEVILNELRGTDEILSTPTFRLQFEVKNVGPATTFDITAMTDNFMFGTTVNPTSLTVGQNEVKNGTVTVNIDPKTPTGMASTVTVRATSPDGRTQFAQQTLDYIPRKVTDKEHSGGIRRHFVVPLLILTMLPRLTF